MLCGGVQTFPLQLMNIKICLPELALRKRLGWFDRIYDPFKSVLFVCVLMPFFIKGEADECNCHVSFTKTPRR